jgi:hypothetical protein
MRIMKLDYCYQCDTFVSTQKRYNVLGIMSFGLFGFAKVCNHCGSKTYKRRYNREKKSEIK